MTSTEKRHTTALDGLISYEIHERAVEAHGAAGHQEVLDQYVTLARTVFMTESGILVPYFYAITPPGQDPDAAHMLARKYEVRCSVRDVFSE